MLSLETFQKSYQPLKTSVRVQRAQIYTHIPSVGIHLHVHACAPSSYVHTFIEQTSPAQAVPIAAKLKTQKMF